MPAVRGPEHSFDENVLPVRLGQLLASGAERLRVHTERETVPRHRVPQSLLREAELIALELDLQHARHPDGRTIVGFAVGKQL